MPIYHLNVHNGLGDLIDEEGSYHVDVTAARWSAIHNIRSLLSAELLEGSVDLTGHLDIVDDAGAIVATVQFDEAVSVQTR